LIAWLRERLSGIRDRDDLPFPPPRDYSIPRQYGDDLIDLSSKPRRWGDLVRGHTELRAWSDHYECQALFEDVVTMIAGSEIKPFSVTHELVPRITAINPNLSFLRTICPEVLCPPPGNRWLLLSLPYLELRCFAAVCDPHGRLVELLRSADDTGHPCLYQGPSIIPAIAHHLEENGGAEEAEKRHRVVRIMAFAISRHLSMESTRRILNTELNLQLRASDVVHLQQAWFKSFPEIEHSQRRYHVPRLSLREWSNLLDGNDYDGNMRTDWNDNFHLSKPFAGRVGQAAAGVQVRTAEFMDLTDAIIKHVAFQVVAHGRRIVACVGDEIIIEVGLEDDAGDVAARLESAAAAAAHAIDPSVPISCLCRTTDSWPSRGPDD
jgi:hypothetical protein